MYYFFCSEYTSALKINGLYYGILSNELTSINVDCERAFLEVLPIRALERSVNFLLDDNFFCAPPSGVSVTDLKGGYLIKFLKGFSSGEFKVIGQQKYPDLLATVFNENGTKLSIETQSDFFAEPILFDVEQTEFYRFPFNNNLLLVAFKSDNILLNVYDVSSSIKKVFSRVVNSFNVERTFTTTEQYKDVAKHVITSTWEYSDGLLNEKEHLVKCSDTFNPTALPRDILPYAFLEELCVGGDYLPYLIGNIKDNADKLKDYLGNFIGVMPPPLFRPQSEVGIILNKSENLYYVDYLTFEFTDGKISNLSKCD